MSTPTTPSLSPQEMLQLVWSQRKLWIATTIGCTVLAAAFSLVMPRYWDAYQGLVIRQETAGASGSRPGKFADLYEMRTMQETILELAKSNQVVTATLEVVGRDMDGVASTPTSEDVDTFRKRLKMAPPDGGEFGKTEVFYFCVKDPSRERAIKLVGEVCRQLDVALKKLRGDRAQNLIAELEQEAALANEVLAAETKRLVEFESQVGPDLGELRMLHSANAGQSDLRTESVQLEADVRKFRTQVRESEKLLALLKAALDDPLQLIATPNSLLTSQPALRRLKDGLVDAQLATSKLGGTRSANHPRVQSATEAELQIREELHDELSMAIGGAHVELQLGRDRLSAAQDRVEDLQARLNRLAELRAEYSNRVAAVENCRLTVDHARQNLSTAKAALAAANSGSLVTRLDEPETGPYPAGIGRTVITGAGGVAGLMLGLGLVFLIVPQHGGANELWLLAKKPRVAGSKLAGQSAIETTNHIDAAMPAAAWWGESTATPASAAVAPSTAATVESPVAAAATIERKPQFIESQPEPRPVTPPPAPVEKPRAKREALPKSAGTLPKTAGSLPPVGATGALGGMTLQQALQAAARQQTT
jgi:polysaccharide biosynthesis transport protein